jgi:hypothetical protein
MSKVYLVYEDDYGGTFSPYWLTTVYPEHEHAKALEHVKNKGWLATLVEAADNGLDKSKYKQSL